MAARALPSYPVVAKTHREKMNCGFALEIGPMTTPESLTVSQATQLTDAGEASKIQGRHILPRGSQTLSYTSDPRQEEGLNHIS